MLSPIIVGMLGGALIARIVVRRRLHRRWAFEGGGCAGRSRFARFRGQGVPVVDDRAERLDARIRSLELNDRQKEDLDEAFATVAAETGVKRVADWPGLARALGAVGADEFDRESLAGEPIGAVDALEHLHNILTPEQRELLRKL
jgi:hypothetical protein